MHTQTEYRKAGAVNAWLGSARGDQLASCEMHVYLLGLQSKRMWLSEKSYKVAVGQLSYLDFHIIIKR